MEAVPAFFKMIYDTARSIKPDALVEFCPCGTEFSFYTLPYLNMSVASDPGSSLQVRMKGKTLKALHGDSIDLLRRPRLARPAPRARGPAAGSAARRLRFHCQHRRRAGHQLHLASGSRRRS